MTYGAEGRQLYTNEQAIEYQRKNYGHVVFGRTALYGLARSGAIQTVRNGQRKILYPQWALDKLLSGNRYSEEK